MALGSLGNLMVLFVYCKNGIAHTTDWFIIFLGIFDFISSFLNVPVYLTFTTGLWSRFGNDIICKIHMTFGQFTCFASPLLIGGLALERYFKVCRTTTTGLSKCGSRNSCMTISVMTFIASVPCIALYDDSNGNYDIIITETVILVVKIYYMAFVAVFITLFIMVIFCYANIAITILKSKKNLEKYTVPTDNSKRPINCFHVMCCIHRSDTSNAPHVNTTEIYVLPESSTSSEKVHDRNKLAKLAKSGNQEKGIKIQDKKSRTNKSLRTTRITFIVCLIFLISWIPLWVGFAINQFAAAETKRTIPHEEIVCM